MKRLCVLALAAMAGGWVGLPAVLAGPASPPPLVVGVVDIERVSQEANPVKDAYAEINRLQASLTQNLLEVDDYAYLTADEAREMLAILEVQERQRTAAQRTRYEDLKKAAGQREKEFGQLAQTPNPTPDQKRRMEELAGMREGKGQVLAEAKQRYQQDLSKKAREVLGKLEKSVVDVINAIARDQKLAMVVSRWINGPTGREEAVLFGGKDITADLIKQLNKSK